MMLSSNNIYYYSNLTKLLLLIVSSSLLLSLTAPTQYYNNIPVGGVTAFTTTTTTTITILGRRRNQLVTTATTTTTTNCYRSRSTSCSMKKPITRLFAASQNRNSFSSFVGDMASSIFGSGLKSNEQIDKAIMEQVSIMSWDDIKQQLHKQQTPEEREFRNNLEYGYGIGSPLHKVRLYDQSNKLDDIRVTLYRDSASWCPYCQKVWMSLEEKQIPYKIEKINMSCYGDKPAEFLRMQPSGQIPAAIIDGKVYKQSNDILYALEELFPNNKSLLSNDRNKMQELLRLERTIFSTWMYWLTSGGNEFKEMFIESLQRVENELNKSNGLFFMGKSVTTVDFQYAPFLERMAASLLYFKGFQIRVPPNVKTDYPNINKWFDAMETLPSYQLTKSDYYTHCWDLPPQLGGCVAEKGGEQYAKAINGERTIDDKQGSWELPLQPHNGGIEPDWLWASSDDATAQREAVERVSANYNSIVKFAARGAGKKGIRMFSAPLADPNATPNEAVQITVDSILRIVCIALLDGDTTKHEEDTIKSIANILIKQGDDEFTNGVINSLVYLRDRIGVPRDMKLPAARQLRAHLNWSIGIILETQSSSK